MFKDGVVKKDLSEKVNDLNQELMRWGQGHKI